MSKHGSKHEESSTDSEERVVDTSRIILPHERFTKRAKWFIVSLIALGGLFSPLTANIYFPAIPTLSVAFKKSTELINLTVTMYMVLQGLAPMFWGPLSDRFGRRPIFAACLFVLSLSCVGLALVPTSAYWLLMILRCLQAAGSASTIAVGAGVIGDISSREERGGFFGIFTLGPMVGPSIGPIIGGALAQRLGWRSIFWFLCIAASVCLLTLLLFMPETLPSISQSKKHNLVYRPVISIIGSSTQPTDDVNSKKKGKNPLLLLMQPDILILLAINAIVCATFYGVTATTSTLFVVAYPNLDVTEIGLCFLAIGGGMAIGSSLNGKILDWEYRTIKKQELVKSEDAETAQQDNPERSDGFPIEKARLRLLPILVLILAASSAGYGWCVQSRVNISGPLILQIAIGYASISIMNSTSTLMIDLVPTQSSAVTACSNLVRCTFSAVLVSIIDFILNGIGIGWTYVLLAGMASLAIPLILLATKVGPRCRLKRKSHALLDQ